MHSGTPFAPHFVAASVHVFGHSQEADDADGVQVFGEAQAVSEPHPPQ